MKNIFSINKVAYNVRHIVLNGEGARKVIQITKFMKSVDFVQQQNKIGFNKPDWGNPDVVAINNYTTSIPAQVALRICKILHKYRRQLINSGFNIEEVQQSISQQIREKTGYGIHDYRKNNQTQSAHNIEEKKLIYISQFKTQNGVTGYYFKLTGLHDTITASRDIVDKVHDLLESYLKTVKAGDQLSASTGVGSDNSDVSKFSPQQLFGVSDRFGAKIFYVNQLVRQVVQGFLSKGDNAFHVENSPADAQQYLAGQKKHQSETFKSEKGQSIGIVKIIQKIQGNYKIFVQPVSRGPQVLVSFFKSKIEQLYKSEKDIDSSIVSLGGNYFNVKQKYINAVIQAFNAIKFKVTGMQVIEQFEKEFKKQQQGYRKDVYQLFKMGRVEVRDVKKDFIVIKVPKSTFALKAELQKAVGRYLQLKNIPYGQLKQFFGPFPVAPNPGKDPQKWGYRVYFTSLVTIINELSRNQYDISQLIPFVPAVKVNQTPQGEVQGGQPGNDGIGGVGPAATDRGVRKQAGVKIIAVTTVSQTGGRWMIGLKPQKKLPDHLKIQLNNGFDSFFPISMTQRTDKDMGQAFFANSQNQLSTSKQLKDLGAKNETQAIRLMIEKGSRVYDWKNYMYLTAGTLTAYQGFCEVLKMKGFDVSSVVQCIAQLQAQSVLIRTKVQDGTLQGYATVQQFDQQLDRNYNKPVTKDGKTFDFKLYPKQKQGIKYLFSKRGAILADDVGLGKTVTAIAAADMKMRQRGGKTVIFTVNNVVDQYAAEIQRFATVNPKDISKDPMQLKTWNILRYDHLSMENSQQITQKLLMQAKNNQITCLICDECHNVKNESKRTQNMFQFSKYIPIVWGASATFVANKPMDIYRQLKLINHPLGQISLSRFKTRYCAMKAISGVDPRRVGRRKKDGTIDSGQFSTYVQGDQKQQAAASVMLKFSLMQSSAFLRRMKQDVREDMPPLNLQDIPLGQQIQDSDINECVNKRARAAGADLSLAVTKMMYQRMCVALKKAPYAAKFAEMVVQSGKKTMIFSAFTDAIDNMQDILQKSLGIDAVGVINGDARRKKLAPLNVVLAKFKDPNSPMKVLILNCKAGGTGIDVPNVTDTVIQNDFDWSVSTNQQVRGRAYRISSNSPVNHLTLVANETLIDSSIRQRVLKKIQISNLIQTLSTQQAALISKMKGEQDVDDKMVQVQNKMQKLLIQQQRLEDEDYLMYQGTKRKQASNQTVIKTDCKTCSRNWYKQAQITQNARRMFDMLNMDLVQHQQKCGYDFILSSTPDMSQFMRMPQWYPKYQIGIQKMGSDFTSLGQQLRDRKQQSKSGIISPVQNNLPKRQQFLTCLKQIIQKWKNQYGTICFSSENIKKTRTYASILSHIGYNLQKKVLQTPIGNQEIYIIK